MDIKQFVKNNLRYILLGVIVIVLVIILVKCVGGNSSKEPKEDEKQDGEIVASDNDALDDKTATENPLEKDAVPEVNDLINRYYTAYAAADVDTLRTLMDNLTDEEIQVMQARKEWVDSYNNIACYTKKGPAENSYVVFAYAEMKFAGDKTQSMAPGLSQMYVCPNADGALFISNSSDPDVEAFMAEVNQSEDVQALVDSVNQKWEEVKAADPTVQEIAKQLNSTEGGGTEVAGGETPAEQPENPDQAQTEPQAGVQDVDETVHATDTVNIRSDANETADRIGQVYKGESIHRTGVLDSGWSRVEYNGQTAYVKSEFLSAEAPAAETPAEQEPAQNASGTPAGGTTTVKDTVNMRESMNESASRVALIYKGEKVTKVMDYAEGWTKVEYNGKTGYVKTEFLN